MSNIIAARAQKFTLQLRDAPDGPAHKIAKIIFDRRDGSLFVNFPYFENSEGIVCIGTIRAGGLPQDVSLIEEGRVTSHLVKYSHHRDGRAHFSQDGKVNTTVKKQSSPLNTYFGHLFTIQLQGLRGFEVSTGKEHDLGNVKDQPITFTVRGKEPQALKVLGYWYTKRELNRFVRGPAGPGTTIKGKGGKARKGVLLSAPWGAPGSGAFLFVSVESIPPINSETYSQLTFLGGFDPPEIINDTNRPTSFLALSYPTREMEVLKTQIGSIDRPST